MTDEKQIKVKRYNGWELAQQSDGPLVEFAEYESLHRQLSLVEKALARCQAMLMESAKQHRNRGDVGHSSLCDVHIEQARLALASTREAAG